MSRRRPVRDLGGAGTSSRPTVVVVQAEAEPVDLAAWAERYVAAVLELERVGASMAEPPAASVG